MSRGYEILSLDELEAVPYHAREGERLLAVERVLGFSAAGINGWGMVRVVCIGTSTAATRPRVARSVYSCRLCGFILQAITCSRSPNFPASTWCSSRARRSRRRLTT